MSRESEREAITSLLKNNWNETEYPVKYPNHKFDEPANKVFMHMILLRGPEQRLTLGSENYLVRCHGALQFDIYLPVDTGEKEANIIEDRLCIIFQDKKLTTSDNQVITFEQPKVLTFGPRLSRHRVMVKFPYHRDVYRSRD